MPGTGPRAFLLHLHPHQDLCKGLGLLCVGEEAEPQMGHIVRSPFTASGAGGTNCWEVEKQGCWPGPSTRRKGVN